MSRSDATFCLTNLTGWRRCQKRRPGWFAVAGCVRCYWWQRRWRRRAMRPLGRASPSGPFLQEGRRWNIRRPITRMPSNEAPPTRLGYRDDCYRGLFSFIIYSSCWQRSDSHFVPQVTQWNIFMHEISVCMWDFCLLRMLAVFSVVISISGSVKYSDATHLPFSGPEGETEGWKERKWREGRNIRVTSGSEVKYMFI